MANSRKIKNQSKYAIVDTAPSSTGYPTNPISINDIKGKPFYFFVKNLSGTTMDAIVTLQFKDKYDLIWSDYIEENVPVRKIIEDSSKDIMWRAIIKNGNYTAGEIHFGFDW